jgi:hypothetical protein
MCQFVLRYGGSSTDKHMGHQCEEEEHRAQCCSRAQAVAAHSTYVRYRSISQSDYRSILLKYATVTRSISDTPSVGGSSWRTITRNHP